MCAKVHEKNAANTTKRLKSVLPFLFGVFLFVGCWAPPSSHSENYIYTTSSERTALVQTVSKRKSNEIQFVCVTFGDGPGGLKITSTTGGQTFRIEYGGQIIFPIGEGRKIYFCDNGSIVSLPLRKRVTKRQIETAIENYSSSEKKATE